MAGAITVFIVALVTLCSLTMVAADIKITVFKCNPSSPRQVWRYNSTNNEIQLPNYHYSGPGNYCLDCQGCTVGEPPHLWPCSYSSPNTNQVWLVNKDTGLLQSKTHPNSCLAAMGSDEGAATVMQSCNASQSNQVWSFDATTGLITLGGSSGAYCLDGGGSTNATCTKAPYNSMPYCNASLPAEARAEDLVSRMTVDEMIANLGNTNPGVERLGVPPMQFNEALHGVVVNCGPTYNGNTGCPTSFPHATALGATFNRSLWLTIGNRISTEARALHNEGLAGLAFWAPDINLFRDPRWGRGQEVPGEDPTLTSEYVMHYSRGMQEGVDTRYLKVISTTKHYADYDQEDSDGTNRVSFNAIVSAQDQVEFYWPAFRAAVEGAHIQSIMCSYNAVNGIPSCAHGLFINTVARQQWNFEGFVVSDCGAVENIMTQHHYTNTTSATCAAALHAGVDLDCGSFYTGYMSEAIASGAVAKDDVVTAQQRLWKHAIMLGMLDDPADQPYTKLGAKNVDTPEHRALALEAAEEAIVLLKNDGNLLPLDDSKTVAVLGPHFNATQDMLSIYRGQNTLVNSHSPLQAIQARGIKVVGATNGVTLCGTNTSGIATAVAAAKSADYALLFVGLHPGQGESCAREDEGWDRTNLTLPGHSLDLVKAVVATGTPTVVVTINGGPLAIEWIKANVPAIVHAFYPGELGGDAIASILFGDRSPGGRLPVTIYPADFIVRPMIDMNLSDKGGITYRYYTGTPLWPFGYGLSYTTFSFQFLGSSMAVLSTDEVAHAHKTWFTQGGQQRAWRTQGTAHFVVNVTNTGSVASDVPVLGIMTNTVPAGGTGPRQELFDFERVHLAPGASTVVYFSASPDVLAEVDERGVQTAVAGTHDVFIGEVAHPERAARGTLRIHGDDIVLFSLPDATTQAGPEFAQAF